MGIALAALLAGSAVGLASRTASDERSGTSAGAMDEPAGRNPSLGTPDNSVPSRDRSTRSHARPAAAVTLSAEQWTKVVANPARYAVSIRKLRSGPVWEPTIAAHADLLGWDDAVKAEVNDAIARFNAELLELEKEKSDVTYAEPDAQGIGIVVTYGRMAAATEALVKDLREGLRNIVGEKDAERFAKIANLSVVSAERDGTIRDELLVQPAGEWLKIRQNLSGSVDRISMMSNPIDSLAVAGPTFTSAAVDWERVAAALNSGTE